MRKLIDVSDVAWAMVFPLVFWMAACNSSSTTASGCVQDPGLCSAGQFCDSVSNTCRVGDGDMGMALTDMAAPPDMTPPGPPPICSSGGWCWQNPLPQGNNLNAVWSADSNNSWAVGVAGTIV